MIGETGKRKVVSDFDIRIYNLAKGASNCALQKGAIKDVHRSNETRDSVFIGRQHTAVRGVVEQLRNHAAGHSTSKNRDGATYRSRADRGLLYRATLL